jgi:hypothetical protein
MSDSPSISQQQGYEANDQEHDEQDLRDSRRTGSNAREAEQRRDERDYEKDDSVVKHLTPPGRPIRPAWTQIRIAASEAAVGRRMQWM